MITARARCASRIATDRCRVVVFLACVIGAIACREPNPVYQTAVDARMTERTDGGAAPRDSQPDFSAPDTHESGDAPMIDTEPSLPDAFPEPTPPDVAADLAADLVADLAPDVAQSACRGSRPNIAGIVKADGIVITSNGTIFYGTTDGADSFVGRLRPDKPLEPKWGAVRGENTNWGLALDESRSRVYLPSEDSSTLYSFDITMDMPTKATFAVNLVGANDVIRAADGSLYVSTHGDRHIHRLADGKNTVATKAPIGLSAEDQAPAGLAFGPDGWLYVGLHTSGRIHRLRLDPMTGNEVERNTGFSTFDGWGNGLAFDQRGRLYVGTYSLDRESSVIRLDENGRNPAPVAKGQFGSLAFGRGPLNPCDLYAADPEGPLQIIETDTPGLPVP